MYGGQYAITTVLTFILAAIVGPEAFGIVAMALVYLAFIQMLVRQGMMPALVQRQRLDATHINSAFWLIFSSGVVLTVGSVLLSGWWADVNRTPDLEQVIDGLSVVIILQSLVVVPEALLSREMDFRSLAVRTNSAALIGGVVGVGLAFAGLGVWALVAQNIVKAVIDVVVLWRLSHWRPRLAFDWTATKDLLGFSANATLAGFGAFVNSRADALIIGLFFGPTAVGLYRLAARLVDVIVEVSVRSFQVVSLPELSRLQNDSPSFADRIISMINFAAVIALPGLAILGGASETVMAVMGEEWAAAATPLALLCLAGAATVFTLFIGPVVMAVGRPHILALVTWGSAAISAAAFVVAGFLLLDAPIEDQVVGIAAAKLAIVATAGVILAVWVISRNSDNSPGSVLKAPMKPALASALGFVITRLLAEVTWPGGQVTNLLFVVVPGTLVTGALLLGIDSRLRERVGRAMRRVPAT
jgi:PST family polysaccharide transporter